MGPGPAPRSARRAHENAPAVRRVAAVRDSGTRHPRAELARWVVVAPRWPVVGGRSPAPGRAPGARRHLRHRDDEMEDPVSRAATAPTRRARSLRPAASPAIVSLVSNAPHVGRRPSGALRCRGRPTRCPHDRRDITPARVHRSATHRLADCERVGVPRRDRAQGLRPDRCHRRGSHPAARRDGRDPHGARHLLDRTGADHESVIAHLADRFDPNADQIICVCAVGYRSRYVPLFIRLFNHQMSSRRRPLSELFFSDHALEHPIDPTTPPYARFGAATRPADGPRRPTTAKPHGRSSKPAPGPARARCTSWPPRPRTTTPPSPWVSGARTGSSDAKRSASMACSNGFNRATMTCHATT